MDIFKEILSLSSLLVDRGLDSNPQDELENCLCDGLVTDALHQFLENYLSGGG